jgi:7,8-dihydropterin-6-yl-methyl-4-(beta-D-ribofuranosyl)aminobenzene 5'-phosphate synthase
MVRRMLKYASSDAPAGVLGGFHLGSSSPDEVLETVQALKTEGIRFAAPTHCSGGVAEACCAEVFSENFFAPAPGFRFCFD